MQMMTLMSIWIKMACVRSGWWFCVRISVLEHLLHRGRGLGARGWGYSLGSGHSQQGQCTTDRALYPGGHLGGPTGCCSQNWGLSLAEGMGLSCHLCPSPVPSKVTLGLHLVAAQKQWLPSTHMLTHSYWNWGYCSHLQKKENIYCQAG